MKCSMCNKEIKYERPPECYINYHRSWRGKDWEPDKTVTYFQFIHHQDNETQSYDSVDSLYFCSSNCLEEWCKDIAEEGYWRD